MASDDVFASLGGSLMKDLMADYEDISPFNIASLESQLDAANTTNNNNTTTSDASTSHQTLPLTNLDGGGVGGTALLSTGSNALFSSAGSVLPPPPGVPPPSAADFLLSSSSSNNNNATNSAMVTSSGKTNIGGGKVSGVGGGDAWTQSLSSFENSLAAQDFLKADLDLKQQKQHTTVGGSSSLNRAPPGLGTKKDKSEDMDDAFGADFVDSLLDEEEEEEEYDVKEELKVGPFPTAPVVEEKEEEVTKKNEVGLPVSELSIAQVAKEKVPEMTVQSPQSDKQQPQQQLSQPQQQQQQQHQSPMQGKNIMSPPAPTMQGMTPPPNFQNTQPPPMMMTPNGPMPMPPPHIIAQMQQQQQQGRMPHPGNHFMPPMGNGGRMPPPPHLQQGGGGGPPPPGVGNNHTQMPPHAQQQPPTQMTSPTGPPPPSNNNKAQNLKKQSNQSSPSPPQFQQQQQHPNAPPHAQFHPQQRQQQPQQSQHRPPHLFNNPQAPPVNAKLITTSLMPPRDLTYVVHAMLRPLHMSDPYTEDFYFVNLQERKSTMFNNMGGGPGPGGLGGGGVGLVKPAWKETKEKAREVELKFREGNMDRAKDWKEEKQVLGQIVKSDVKRPRALLATSILHKSTFEPPTSSDPTSEEDSIRTNLWKARTLVDKGYRAFLDLFELQRLLQTPLPSKPREELMMDVEKKIDLLHDSLGVVTDAPNKTKKVDVDVLRSTLSLPKGQELASRSMERGLLPHASACIIVPEVLRILFASPRPTNMTNNAIMKEDRLLRSLTAVISMMNPSLKPETVLECLSGVLEVNKNTSGGLKAVLGAQGRAEVMHAVLARGGNILNGPGANASEELKVEWREKEGLFLKMLSMA